MASSREAAQRIAAPSRRYSLKVSNMPTPSMELTWNPSAALTFVRLKTPEKGARVLGFAVVFSFDIARTTSVGDVLRFGAAKRGSGGLSSFASAL